MPIRCYEGEVCLVATPSDLERAVADIGGQQVVMGRGRRPGSSRRAGLAQTGLRNLAGVFLGFRIPKGKRTSNWAAVRLSPAQIAYAATDAWVCRELFLCFEQLGLLGADGPA